MMASNGTNKTVTFVILVISTSMFLYMNHQINMQVSRERILSQTTDLGSFQYVHPQNKSFKGKEFKMNIAVYSLALQLMDELENGKKVDTITLESLMEAMAPVTAVSSNHLKELLKHLDGFQKFVPNKTLIVYDLGLTEREVKTLKAINFVEYRNFHFSGYPEHVRKLKSYAFKPLIIQQVVAERGGALWMDAGVKFVRLYTKALEQMVDNTSGFLYYLVPNAHSIQAVTRNQMFEYLPMKKNNANENQPQANGFLVFNTPQTREYIFKWAILCSLVSKCIIPKGSTVSCKFDKSGRQTKPGCHRYDQSMFSILLLNLYSPKTEKYILSKERILAVPHKLYFDREWGDFLSWFE